MNTFRKIVTCLLLIPAGMVFYAIAYPQLPSTNSGLEYLYLLIGLPILILNYYAWFEPKLIADFFPILKENGIPGTEKKPVLEAVLTALTIQNRWIPTILILTLAGGIISGAGLVSAFYEAGANPLREQDGSFSAQATGDVVVRGDAQSPANTPIATNTDGAVPGAASTLESMAVTSGPVLSATPTVALPTGSPEPTEVLATATLLPLSCVPASADFLDGANIWVNYIDAENEVGTGWVVNSEHVENLWFMAAKIYGPGIEGGFTPPAVWAAFVSPDGSIDFYSVNSFALNYSSTNPGEESSPVTSMQSSGAQEAYNCAVNSD